MAVYKRTYHPYQGSVTPHWSRFLVIPRYAFEELRQSRRMVLLFIVGLIIPLFFGLAIYLPHNLALSQILNNNGVAQPGSPMRRSIVLFSIDAKFFLNFLAGQTLLGFFLAAFIGPGLISPDLANNAIPLYLARPFSRAEYILGKLSVLAILFSALTWVPGLLLFGLQAYVEGQNWGADNLRIAGAIIAGSWIWILVVSLLALALSAWVKWKPAAGGLLFGVFFVAAGFGAMVNATLRTPWGALLNISHLINMAWLWLFGLTASDRVVQIRGPRAPQDNVPLWSVWLMLFAICGFCLWMLLKKVRGAEVVR